MDSFLENSCYWSWSKDPLRKIKQEYCEDKIWNGYAERAQKCFDASYARFSNNPEYLYYASKILIHSYFMIDLAVQESLLEDMYQRSQNLGYNKIIEEQPSGDMDSILWAQRIVNDVSLREQLASKGAVGEYILGASFVAAQEIIAQGREKRKNS